MRWQKRKIKKRFDRETQVKIAKYTAIAAWSVPATELIKLAKSLIKTFFK